MQGASWALGSSRERFFSPVMFYELSAALLSLLKQDDAINS